MPFKAALNVSDSIISISLVLSSGPSHAAAEPSHHPLGERGSGSPPGRSLQTEVHVRRRSQPLQEIDTSVSG